MTILLYHLTDLHQAAPAAADRRAGHPADLHLSAAEAASAVAAEWAMVAADQAVEAVQEDADAKNYIKKHFKDLPVGRSLFRHLYDFVLTFISSRVREGCSIRKFR